jgi:hypothetical protein
MPSWQHVKQSAAAGDYLGLAAPGTSLSSVTGTPPVNEPRAPLGGTESLIKPSPAPAHPSPWCSRVFVAPVSCSTAAAFTGKSCAGQRHRATSKPLIHRIKRLHQSTATRISAIVFQRQFLLDLICRTKIQQHHARLGIAVTRSVNRLQSHQCSLADVPTVIGGSPERHHR